ncbi:thiolase family protein [Desulfobacterota bacterium AH_259_B03_O07]|nr:thiolase family protein [Desulfobacterota bacterium AH_259_B03_O07]
MKPHNLGIIGVGQTTYVTRRDDVTLPELAREAAATALEDAGIEFKDIDGVVFSLALDALEGIEGGEKWCAEALGGYGKPFLRVHTGGAAGGSAVHTGFFHIASGHFNCVLVVGSEKMGETPDAQSVLNQIFDPIYERELAINAVNMCSFQAVRHMKKYGTSEYHMALVAVRSRKNALNNPYAHIKKEVTVDDVLNSKMICYPLKLYDCCPRSTGSCAVVLASESFIKKIRKKKVAWIKGVASCTNSYYMGDRMNGSCINDYADSEALFLAAKKAYNMAGINNPNREIDVAEIYAPFTSTELAAVEALGFCEKGESGICNEKGIFEMDGEIPVNPSGGVLTANPISATALARVAEAALQVIEKAGERQVRKVGTAVATGEGGSLQFYTVTVLSNKI